jgi:hypothetical protein
MLAEPLDHGVAVLERVSSTIISPSVLAPSVAFGPDGRRRGLGTHVPKLKSIHVDGQHTEAARTTTGSTTTAEAAATPARRVTCAQSARVYAFTDQRPRRSSPIAETGLRPIAKSYGLETSSPVVGDSRSENGSGESRMASRRAWVRECL